MIDRDIEDKLLQRFSVLAELPAKARQALFTQGVVHRIPAGAMDLGRLLNWVRDQQTE